MNKSKILVPLGKKSYEVAIEAGIRNKISEELLKIGVKNNRKILVISNKEISDLYIEEFFVQKALLNYLYIFFQAKKLLKSLRIFSCKILRNQL